LYCIILYVYFRYDEKQTIMVVMNTSKSEKEVHISNYRERVDGFNNFNDIINKNKGHLIDFNIGSYKTKVYELTP